MITYVNLCMSVGPSMNVHMHKLLAINIYDVRLHMFHSDNWQHVYVMMLSIYYGMMINYKYEESVYKYLE